TVSVTVTDFDEGRVSSSVAVNVSSPSSPPPPPPTTETLTISNIQVTDITPSSAIIRWTTSRAASSRVIYDIVSHPSLTGQVAPNFGYAFSTGTSDSSSGVIDHAVTVSGLQPNTTYFFRVLSQ
ncbi:MAG: fibronectin type III domain-containing protein, partial [Patescibacteria group bacterium]